MPNSAELRRRAADLRRKASDVRDYAIQRDLLYIAKQYEAHARNIDLGGAKIDGNAPEEPARR